jgi:hypothetical protein
MDAGIIAALFILVVYFKSCVEDPSHLKSNPTTLHPTVRPAFPTLSESPRCFEPGWDYLEIVFVANEPSPAE